MVIVQFRGRLVRQYRACVVDSLGLGITCLIFHCTVYTASGSFMPSHSNLLVSSHFKLTILNLLIIVSSNATSSNVVGTTREGSVKKHTNKTHHRHINLISPSSLQHPPHLFNTNHTQPLHLTFKTKYSCFSPNHSTPIPNRKVTNLTPTKSQSKYNMILYACTNEKYLIPISVPILPHTTPQDRIIPHITSCVYSGRCDGVILLV